MIALKTYLDSFAPVHEEAWNELSSLFQKVVLKRGEFLIQEGQIATQFVFVESGVIRAFYRDERGTEYNKHFFTSPSIAGAYTSLITGKPNQIIQQALLDCHLIAADYQSIVQLYDHFQELERIGRLFAERYFVEKEQKELEMARYGAENRYAIFQKRYPLLEQDIPQYHIASYLGITPTQLSRIRKKLAQG